jgi:hypothetical protein
MRRSQGWYGAAVITGLALAVPPAAPAAAVDDSVGQAVAQVPVGQTVGQVTGQIQDLTEQPPPALSTPQSSPGKAPPSRPAPAAAQGGASDGPAAPAAPVASSPRAGGRESTGATTASPGARIASEPKAAHPATSSDPTDAKPDAATRPASQVVSAGGHDAGALPFTGWELLPVAVLGLFSFGLGGVLLSAVRNRWPRSASGSPT